MIRLQSRKKNACYLSFTCRWLFWSGHFCSYILLIIRQLDITTMCVYYLSN
ncbi:unnamed protein product [Musa banksii]